MRALLLLMLANLGRRLTEWADDRGDRHDRHIIDLLRAVLTSR